ncbi:hypothetical protein ACP4OV_020777 [Aristida adscensionis]
MGWDDRAPAMRGRRRWVAGPPAYYDADIEADTGLPTPEEAAAAAARAARPPPQVRLRQGSEMTAWSDILCERQCRSRATRPRRTPPAAAAPPRRLRRVLRHKFDDGGKGDESRGPIYSGNDDAGDGRRGHDGRWRQRPALARPIHERCLRCSMTYTPLTRC